MENEDELFTVFFGLAFHAKLSSHRRPDGQSSTPDDHQIIVAESLDATDKALAALKARLGR